MLKPPQRSYDSRQYAYANRPGSNFGSQYRAPENNFRGNGGSTYNAYRSHEFARAQSGGSHFFGGHDSNGFGKAPKSNFGGGHSSWGGGGGFKAPKALKESHSGGGHSAGGHSGHHR